MRKSQVTLSVAVAVAVVAAAAAQATPPSGVVSATIVARSGFVDRVDLKLKVHTDRTEVIHVQDAQDTVMQQIVLGPNGHTGWHSHPGPVVVLVKAGALTLHDGEDAACPSRTYSAGQAFIDRGQGHVHLGRNPSSTDNTELWVTYFDVPVGSGVRIDAADPGNCGF